MGRKAGEPKTKLGQAIQRGRIEKGYLSQGDLAAVTGLNVKSINKWETSDRIPRKGTIDKLNEVLKIDLYQYLEEESNIETKTSKINEVSNSKNKDPQKSQQKLTKAKREKELVVDLKINHHSLTLLDFRNLLTDVYEAWFTQKHSSLKFFREAFIINELQLMITIKENHFIVKSKHDNILHYFDVIGFPAVRTAIKDPITQTYTILWLNYYMSEIEKAQFIIEVFDKKELHYYSPGLSWIVMKMRSFEPSTMK